MEAWLSWLEHTVHIREVTGSSPVVSTNAKTLLFSRVFLLPLVSATGSKVRSAPHTLCALCHSVTLHAPLSNASISAPLMGESCPSATRNLKRIFRRIMRSICVWYEILSEKQDGRLPCKRLVLLHFFFCRWCLQQAQRSVPHRAHCVPCDHGHTARSALKCEHFRSADERVLPIHHTQPERLFRLFFVFRSIVLAQSVAGNKR